MSGLVYAAGRPWPQLLRSVLDQLDGRPDDADLGLVFLADPTTEMADVMLEGLRQRTGIRTWLGAASTAVFAGGQELRGEGAIAALPLALGRPTLHPFAGTLPRDGRGARCGILHVPDDADAAAAVAAIAAATPAVLAGAQGASSFDHAQFTGSPSAGSATGVLFSGDIVMVTGISHGALALGPPHRVTGGGGTTLASLDGHPALVVLAAEAGELAARDARHWRRQFVLAAVPAEAPSSRPRVLDAAPAGAAPAPATPLLGIANVDPVRGTIELDSRHVVAGMPARVRLYRRDPARALDELRALAAVLLGRLQRRPPRAALLYSSIERGQGFFGPGIDEAAVLASVLGPVPVIGMRSAAEIAGSGLTRHAAALALIA